MQHTLRYFVRSYVTRATTISAITEMPANTPKPIGSTCNFLPGIANGVADALSAAAVPEDAAPAAVTEVLDESVADASSAADAEEELEAALAVELADEADDEIETDDTGYSDMK